MQRAIDAPPPRRILYYCHDTYGLGHLRRAATLAHHLHRRWPDAAQLVVTGSPVAGTVPLPPGADTVKLPCVVKTGADAYRARSLATGFEPVRALRSALLREAAHHFAPDVVVVDHAPAGLKGEARAMLTYLRRRRPATRLVLGLRDVVDDPAATVGAWRREGIYPLLDEVYDRILVYGQRDVFDPVGAYGLSARAAAKVRFVGYLRRAAEPVPAEVRALRADERPLVLVTAGGGGDGAPLFDAFVRGCAAHGTPLPFRAVVVAGPFLPAEDARRLRRLAEPVEGLTVLASVPGLAGVIDAADAVVAMAGYNTTCEILSFGKPALLVPRTHPRREQLIRAAALQRRGLVDMLPPEAATPERLMAGVAALLSGPRRAPRPLALDGLERVADELVALLDGSPSNDQPAIASRARRAAARPHPEEAWR